MSIFERKFNFGMAVTFIILGSIFTIWGLKELKPSGNILKPETPYFPFLFFGLLCLCLYSCELIFIIYLKSRYEEYQSDEVCDSCGETVEKINLRNYGLAKLIFCKKCHKRYHVINLIFMESWLLILNILSLYMYLSLGNINSIIIGIVLMAAIPIIIIFYIRRY
ncbi:MAG: hypothetical protein ACFFDN_09500 [Candidatus Hodarchaeota archaeon]